MMVHIVVPTASLRGNVLNGQVHNSHKKIKNNKPTNNSKPAALRNVKSIHALAIVSEKAEADDGDNHQAKVTESADADRSSRFLIHNKSKKKSSSLLDIEVKEEHFLTHHNGLWDLYYKTSNPQSFSDLSTNCETTTTDAEEVHNSNRQPKRNIVGVMEHHYALVPHQPGIDIADCRKWAEWTFLQECQACQIRVELEWEIVGRFHFNSNHTIISLTEIQSHHHHQDILNKICSCDTSLSSASSACSSRSVDNTAGDDKSLSLPHELALSTALHPPVSSSSMPPDVEFHHRWHVEMFMDQIEVKDDHVRPSTSTLKQAKATKAKRITTGILATLTGNLLKSKKINALNHEKSCGHHHARVMSASKACVMQKNDWQ